MKLSTAINCLKAEMEYRGDIELYFVDFDGKILRLKEITSHPLNQEDGSWGIDSCFWMLGE